MAWFWPLSQLVAAITSSSPKQAVHTLEAACGWDWVTLQSCVWSGLASDCSILIVFLMPFRGSELNTTIVLDRLGFGKVINMPQTFHHSLFKY